MTLRVMLAGASCLALAWSGCTCSKRTPTQAPADGPASSSRAEGAEGREAAAKGLSAPLAAIVLEGGDMVVAGLDEAAKAIRVQRLGARDETTRERLVFDGVRRSADSSLAIAPTSEGVLVTWRGLRGPALVRQVLRLDLDLKPIGEVVDVSATSCATPSALWFVQGRAIHGRPWSGPARKVEMPSEGDTSLLCADHRAFAWIEQDDALSVLPLGDAEFAPKPRVLVRESEFGRDEPRERAEFAVADDVGMVRVASSGALAIRELRGDAGVTKRSLKTTIAHEEDLVVVEASPRILGIVLTEDVGAKCPGAGETTATRIKALVVDRASFAESVVELSPGACGREVGPFFASALGDDVSVAWVERVPVQGEAGAPIAALAARRLTAARGLVREDPLEAPADALAFAGCHANRCYAVALTHAFTGPALRVLRYHVPLSR